MTRFSMSKSKQETFDTVAKHLLTQKVRSFKQEAGSSDPYEGLCMYRGPDGTKCAAGCLIPDEDYKPEWEGAIVSHKLPAPTIANSEPTSNYRSSIALSACISGLGHDVTLVRRLQMIHDQRLPEQWKAALARLASDDGLNDSVLDAFPA